MRGSEAPNIASIASRVGRNRKNVVASVSAHLSCNGCSYRSDPGLLTCMHCSHARLHQLREAVHRREVIVSNHAHTFTSCQPPPSRLARSNPLHARVMHSTRVRRTCSAGRAPGCRVALMCASDWLRRAIGSELAWSVSSRLFQSGGASHCVSKSWKVNCDGEGRPAGLRSTCCQRTRAAALPFLCRSPVSVTMCHAVLNCDATLRCGMS